MLDYSARVAGGPAAWAVRKPTDWACSAGAGRAGLVTPMAAVFEARAVAWRGGPSAADGIFVWRKGVQSRRGKAGSQCFPYPAGVEPLAARAIRRHQSAIV